MFRKCIRAVAVVGLASNIAGCVLINPHISWEPPNAEKVTAANAPKLSWAKAYANNAKEAYMEALGEYATFSSLLGIGLIPIAASGAGLGAVGGDPNAVIALALAGASGYGIGTWLESKPRQKAFLLGYEATACATEAVLPLDFTATKKSALGTNRKNLNSAIGDVETQIGKTSGAADKVAAESDLKSRATSDISAAQQVVTAAKITHKNGMELERQIDMAGGMLIEAVDKIKGQVSSAVIELAPTAESLKNIIDGLAKSYKQFAPVSEGPKTSKDIKGGGEVKDPPKVQTLGDGIKLQVAANPEEELRAELNNLRSKVTDLANKNREIADLVAVISSAEPTETLKKCGVKESDIALGISVAVHGSLEFEQGTPGTGGFTVSGGSEKYRYTIHGSSEKLPTVEQDSPFGGGFIVKTKTDTDAGLSKILVQDTAGHRQFVDVTVKPKKKGTDGSVTDDVTLSVVRAKALQSALGMSGDDIDGKIGEKTREKIKEFETKSGIDTPTGKVTEDLLKGIWDLSKLGLNEYEKELSKTKIKDIQEKALGMEGDQLTGLLDEATRSVIIKIEEEKELPKSGRLTGDLLQKLDYQ